MKSFEDYCSVLGVDVNVTREQLKKAYRDLVRIWHPDRFANDPRLQEKADAKLKEINDAYKQLQVLLATSRRSQQQRADTHPKTAEKNRTGRQHSASTGSPNQKSTPRSSAAYEPGLKVRHWLASLQSKVAVLAIVALLALVVGLLFFTANLRQDVLGRMKESRDSAAKLLALHEEEQMTLQKKYELRRELYLRGQIAKAELTEAEQALTDAILRVYEDRRRLAEADRAIEQQSATLQSGHATQ